MFVILYTFAMLLGYISYPYMQVLCEEEYCMSA